MSGQPQYPHVWTILLVDYLPPSLNVTRREHWSEVRKHKQRAIERLFIACANSGGKPCFVGPVKVSIGRLWGKGQRALDHDNLFGGVKPLIDAMRRPKKAGKGGQGGLGIIEDDAPHMLDLDVWQEKNTGEQFEDLASGVPATVVQVEGVRGVRE